MGELEPTLLDQPTAANAPDQEAAQDLGMWQRGWDMLPAGGKKTIALIGGVGALAAGVSIASQFHESDQAYGDTSPSNAQIISSQSSAFFAIGKSQHQEADVATGKVTFLSNIRSKPMPKSWVNRQKKAGNCEMVGAGTDHPLVYTQGHNVNNMSLYGADSRRSLVCNGIRVACGNKVRFIKPPNTVPGEVIWVRSFANAMVKIQASAEAKASANCHTLDNAASAMAYGEGSASSKEEVRLKLFAKTKGAALVRLSGQMTASANAKAAANAEAQCSENTSSATTETTTETVPPPPTTTTIPPPPPKPPEHGCDLGQIIQKDGRTLKLFINDSGMLETDHIDWGDESSSTYTNSEVQSVVTHFYDSNSTFKVTDTQSYPDGGKAECTTTVTTDDTGPPNPPPV